MSIELHYTMHIHNSWKLENGEYCSDMATFTYTEQGNKDVKAFNH